MKKSLLAGLVLLCGGTLASAREPYVEIDLSDRTLTYHADSTYAYDIAVGKKGYRTPPGEYMIRDIIKNPRWCPDPEKKWLTAAQKEYLLRERCIPYGHQLNPLSKYWMRIGNDLGIHGTSNTLSIKRQWSHGCIRMDMDDITDLVEKRGITPGTPVTIKE